VYQRRRRIRVAPARRIPFSPFLGMILMATSFFLYATSGVVAPWYGVLGLLIVWLALFLLCCAWWTPHPTRLPAIGAASFVIWFCTLVGGAMFLGWSA
jgi:hypothetical protein